MTKEQKLIKELKVELGNLKAENEMLTMKLKDAEDSKDRWYKQYNEKEAQLDQLHRTFDALEVPGKVKVGDYDRILDCSSRLTLLIAKIGLNAVIRVKESKEE